MEPLPTSLIELVREQRAILFLGAGASRGAIHKEQKPIPTSADLRDSISDQFLGGQLKQKSLAAVAEIAANEHSLQALQAFVSSIFMPFQPASHHLLIPAFRWRAIATTNFDLIVERAYGRASGQTLVAFIKDTEAFDTKLRSTRDPLEYIKLHGSIDHPNDNEAPFILGQEQYSKYDNNRKRLYSRLRDLFTEYPVVFAGYSIEDAHIQNILFSFTDSNVARPMYFAILPEASEYEVRYWGKHRITVVKAEFGSVLALLDKSIPTHARSIPAAIGGGSSTLRSFYIKANVTEDPSLLGFLSEDVTHVYRGMRVNPQDPRRFYKGYDEGWGCIAQDLDVPRRITDSILLDAVLLEEPNDAPVRFFVLKGPGGQGKTVTLKRVAWEAANSYDKLVLFHKPSGAIRPEAFFEIHALTKSRIYLFVDRVSLVREEIHRLLQAAAERQIPISVIGADRNNEWDTYCDFLNPRVTQDFYLGHLSHPEISGLLGLLEKHGALGVLSELSSEQRLERFTSRADRQLLVALHEATQGKPFEEIVHDEYLSIPVTEARQLYFEICCLNQFGAPVRAGLMKRTSGIGFEEFGAKFLTPLRDLVYIGRDDYSGDYTYRARHQHVAEIVFYSATASEEDRFNALVDIISWMNTSYSSDRETFMRMVRGRNIKEMFSDVSLGRLFFDRAEDADAGNAFVLQQRAIFEMQHPHGDLLLAETAANEASELHPTSRSIAHTQAEVARRLAKMTSDPLRKEAYRHTARTRLPNDSSSSEYDYHTRIRLNLDELEELLARPALEANKKQIVELSKSIEQSLEIALQAFPNSEHLLAVEAEYKDALNQSQVALTILKRAFDINPRQDWLAVRLATRLRNEGDLEAAIKVLRTNISENPNSKIANRRLAEYLDEIGAGALIQDVRTGKRLFTGEVVRKEEGYAFVKVADFDEELFAHASDSETEDWVILDSFDPIQFFVGFNRRGPRALSLRKTKRRN